MPVKAPIPSRERNLSPGRRKKPPSTLRRAMSSPGVTVKLSTKFDEVPWKTCVRARACYASGAGLKLVHCGQICKFLVHWNFDRPSASYASVKRSLTVQLLPKEFNWRKAAEQGLATLNNLGHPDGKIEDLHKIIDILMDDNRSNQVEVNYGPVKAAGKYLLSVRLDGAQISGSPFNVDVMAANTNALSSELQGDREWENTSRATTGVSGYFKIIARDQFGNRRRTGNDVFDVELRVRSDTVANCETTEGNLAPDEVSCIVMDNGDGTYHVRYVRSIAAQYEAVVMLGGVPVNPMITVIVEAGPAHAPSCIAKGEALSEAIAGKNATFVVAARDQFGNLRSQGGDRWEVACVPRDSSVAPVFADVFDQGNGMYNCIYKVDTACYYDIHILLQGEDHIHQSAFPLTVIPSAQDANSSKCFGEGLRHAVAGETTTFFIHPKDFHGNMAQAQRHFNNLKVYMQDTNSAYEADIHVTINDDGQYEVEYVAKQSGQYHIRVEFEDRPVAGSPYTCFIEPGPTHPPSCEVEGLGMGVGPCGDGEGYAGEWYTGRVTLYDCFGNRRLTGNDTVAVALISDDDVIWGEVEDHENGLFTLKYTTNRSGPCKVRVTVGGEEAGLPGGNFNMLFHASETHGPSCSLVEGTRIHKEVLICNQPVLFTVECRDRYGSRRLTGGDSLQVHTGASDEAITVDDMGDGTYDVTFAPLLVGQHVIHVSVNNVEIRDSPFLFQVIAGMTVAENSIAYGAGLERATLFERTSFLIHACDGNNHKKTVGGDAFHVSVNPSGKYCTMEELVDNLNGTYSCSYRAEITGLYTIAITLDKVHIRGSPFKVTCYSQEQMRTLPKGPRVLTA